VETIAFVAGQLSGGGAEQQLLCLLKGLTRYRVRVALATLNPEFPGEATFEAAGLAIHRVPRSRLKVDRVLRLARWLRRERPLLVHSWHFYGNALSAWAGMLAGVPVRIGSLRSDASVAGAVSGRPSRLYLRLGLEVPDLVVANSGATVAGLADGRYPWGQVRVVRNGLDLAALRAASAINWDGRSDPPAAGPVLALVGRLVPVKNAPMFLRVIAGLAGAHPGVQGWLIGDGPQRDPLEQLAEGLGIKDRIRFCGWQAGAAGLLAGVDILCHCSHSEGLPNAIMEASALGLPVVATRVGGTPEVVDEGATGFLVDPDDAAAMVDHVDRLLGDEPLRTQMGQAGRRKMESEFSQERMVGDMVALYRELLAQKAPRAVPSFGS
jgi:glycosyltransferase involved in cell wall biosynthesis